MRMQLFSGHRRISLDVEDVVIRLERRDGCLVHVRAKQGKRLWQVIDLGTMVYEPEPDEIQRQRAESILHEYGVGGPLAQMLVDDLMNDDVWEGAAA